MSDTDIQFIRNLKNTIWGASLLLFTGMLTAGVGFYYKANKDIEYIQRDLHRIENQKVNKELFETTIISIEKELININRKL